MPKDDLKNDVKTQLSMAEMNEKINKLEEKLKQKEIEEKTDVLAKGLNKPQQGGLILFFIALVFGYIYLVLSFARNTDAFSLKATGALYTLLITACFIILDFCPFASRKKRTYTVILRVFTCISVLLGLFYLT